MIRHSALFLALALLATAAPAQEGPKEPGTAPGAEKPAPPAPPAETKEIPKAAPRAPLPADPSEKIKKTIQPALIDWFRNEPGTPGRKAPTEVQGDRQGAAGKVEKACMEWNALLGPAGANWGCLRNVAWWKARLNETQPTENYTKRISKEEFTYKDKKYHLATSVPKAYRGTGTEVYPLILTCIDKDADPKKVFPAIYGPLLDTHVVVASYENNLKDEQGRDMATLMFYGIYWAESVVRIDRDRVVLDGTGKGARFVDELAGDMGLQWNGAVFRNPTALPELVGNLGLYPCCAVLPAVAPEGMTKTVDAILQWSPAPPSLLVTGAPEDAASLTKVQDWIGTLKPRRVSDQRETYTYWMRSKGRAKWGYWFKAVGAVESGPDSPFIKVKVSRDPERNVVRLDAENLAEGEVFLNDEVLDLDQTVHVVVNGIEVASDKPTRSLMNTLHAADGLGQTRFGPRNYFIVASIPFRVTGEALKTEEQRKSELAVAEAQKRAAEAAANPPPAEAPKDGAPAEAPKESAPAPGDGAGPAPPTPPTPPAPQVIEWGGDFAAALEAAKKAGKGVLVHFAGAAEAPGQAAVNRVLGMPELRDDLARFVCVLLPIEGEAGKGAKERLEKVSPGAAAPFLAVLKAEDESVTGRLAAATLKEEDLFPEIRKLLGAESAKKPEDQKMLWMTEFGEAEKAAQSNGNLMVVLFVGTEKEPGYFNLAAILDEADAVKRLARVPCVKLSVAGDENKSNAARLKGVSPDKPAPLLTAYRLVEKDWKNLGTVEPQGQTKDEVRRRLIKMLDEEWLPRRETQAPTPAAGGDKPAEPKPPEKKDAPAAEAPKPEAPKADAPK